MYRGWCLTNARRSNMVAESRKILGWLYKPWWMSAVTITVLRSCRLDIFIQNIIFCAINYCALSNFSGLSNPDGMRTGTVIDKDKQIKEIIIIIIQSCLVIQWCIAGPRHCYMLRSPQFTDGQQGSPAFWILNNPEGGIPQRPHAVTLSQESGRYGPSYKRNEKRNSLSGKFRRARMV